MNKFDEKLKDFSGSILVSKDNEIIINNSYGFENIEEGIKNKNNTRYAIGSISKVFTAIGIMKLYEEGKIDINESVKKYLQIENLEENIKITHLLNHTSGLKNFVLYRKKFNLYENNKAEEIVKEICNMKRDFRAGAKFSYNNTGYLILALIIEKVSETKFEDYIFKNIFLKLDMRESSFLSIDSVNIAKGYKKGKLTKLFHHSSFWGCGDIVSTTMDLNKFIYGINTGKIINKDLVQEMQKIHGKNIMLKYGYGFMIGNRSGEKSIGHSGSIPNSYAAKLSYYYKNNLLIIVLCNDIKTMNRYIPGVMVPQYIERYLYMQYI